VDDRFVTGYGRETNLIERWYWRKKCKQLQYLRPWLVGPSNWTIGEARRAILWRDRAQFACIPYPLDTSPFSPRLIADARRRVGIPEDAHVVLFGCVGGTRSPIKGFSLLADALGRVNPALRAKMQVLVFGEECRTFEPVHGVPVRGAGIIHDVESLAWLYAAADVFAFPSRKETFGQTKIEALASGVPVVAFRTTACSDGVQHGETGWVCAPFDTSQFAEGLTYLLGMKESHPAQWTILREKCRTSIGAFAPASIAARWLQAYTDLLKQHRSCNHDEQKQAAAKANIPEAK
jgi:glycosyltransferase involved in cell wall biosynthesis